MVFEMTEKETEDIKAIIKKELVRTKDDINRGILESVRDLKNLMIIEEGTGRIVILNKEKFKNIDKVSLMMLGKTIADIGGVVSSSEADIQTISDELGIVKTTLSAPIGELLRKNILLKNEGKYRFNEAFIKEEVKRLVEKIKNE